MRLKIEKKEGRILMLSSFTFHQEQKGPVKIAYLTKDDIQQYCLAHRKPRQDYVLRKEDHQVNVCLFSLALALLFSV